MRRQALAFGQGRCDTPERFRGSPRNTDQAVVFHALDEKHIKSIAKIPLGYLEKRLAQLEMKLDADDSALFEVANAGFDPVFGVRPLKRAIQAQIENPVANAILEGRFAAKGTIRVSCVGGVMRFEKE